MRLSDLTILEYGISGRSPEGFADKTPAFPKRDQPIVPQNMHGALYHYTTAIPKIGKSGVLKAPVAFSETLGYKFAARISRQAIVGWACLEFPKSALSVVKVADDPASSGLDADVIADWEDEKTWVSEKPVELSKATRCLVNPRMAEIACAYLSENTFKRLAKKFPELRETALVWAAVDSANDPRPPAAESLKLLMAYYSIFLGDIPISRMPA